MKNISVKVLCYVLALTVMVTTISIMNSDLSALAMERFNPEEESQEEFINYMHTNKNKIEINIIGDMQVNNNISFDYIAKSTDELNYLSQDRESSEISVRDLNENKATSTEFFKIDGIKKVENTASAKAKTNKDQTKAYIISNEKIQEFLSPDNMENVDDVLSKGYSLYFVTDSDYEIDLINHKFGLLDFLPKEENYAQEIEYSQKVLEDYDEGEDISTNDAFTIGCYISRNMAGEYFYGTLASSIEKEDIYDSVVMHAVLRRKNFTSYKDINNVKAQDISLSLSAAAATENERSNFQNWHIITYGRESWFQVYGEEWASNFYIKIGDIHIGNITTYDTYGYSIDEENRALYINVIRMGVVPYNGVTTKSVYWENISVQNNINLYQFGPQYQPQTNVLTLGFNSEFNVKAGFKGDNSVGGSIGFSASYSFDFKEITVTNLHADPQTRTATADFAYSNLFNTGTACKQYSENTAYSVFRATESGAIQFRPQQKVVIQFNDKLGFFNTHIYTDSHYQYPISRTITPGVACF